MNIQEIMKKLSEPFKEDELEFKVMATNPEKTQGLAAAYVQARAIQNRLDEVLGLDRWKVEYIEIAGGFLCRLSLKIDNEWISKEDGAPITEFESIKGGISSAFKRVASSGFGIGRYLYSARNSWFPIRAKGSKGYEFISTPRLNLPSKSKNEEPVERTSSTIDTANIDKILEFGKYKGETLRNIYIKDRNYFNYIKKSTKDESIVNLCSLVEEIVS